MLSGFPCAYYSANKFGNTDRNHLKHFVRSCHLSIVFARTLLRVSFNSKIVFLIHCFIFNYFFVFFVCGVHRLSFPCQLRFHVISLFSFHLLVVCVFHLRCSFVVFSITLCHFIFAVAEKVARKLPN